MEDLDARSLPKVHAPMHVVLELSGHPKANVQRVLLADTTVVGRSRVCGLQIASATVSRKHCEIRLNGEAASVVDLGSSNGTYVDSERLPAGEERVLRPGCRLNIGGVRFQVQYEAAPGDANAGPLAAAISAAAESVGSESELESDEEIAADQPILPDESLLPEEPLPTRDPVAPEAPISSAASDEPVELSLDDPDLSDLFADEPAPPHSDAHKINNRTTPAEVLSDDEPILEKDEPILEEEDEPILSADEDQAFAFLTDDEPTAASTNRRDDSEIRDVLRQH